MSRPLSGHPEAVKIHKFQITIFNITQRMADRSQAAEVVTLYLFTERYTIIPPFIVLTKNVRAIIHVCPNTFLQKLLSNPVRLMSFWDALSHTRTQPYAIKYILHFIMWTLQVLTDGQYSTQPLEWIMHGQENNKCRLTTELQPGESRGFLRPCGKESKKQNLLLIENCPSDWTDHETAQKCNAYALYSSIPLTVSSKKNMLTIHFTSPP